MTAKNIDELREAFQAFVEARARLLDAGCTACEQRAVYPNMRNIWQEILVELFGMQSSEKAMDLAAGLMQIAQEHMDSGNVGIGFGD